MQDKQRNHLKEACASVEEIEMLSKEMEERKVMFETRSRALPEKSGDSRKAADGLEVEIQAVQAGEERRGSCASQSNGCCCDPAMVKHVLAIGATQALQQLAFIHGEISRVYGGQHPPEPAALERGGGAEEKEAWEGDWDDEKTPNE